jgi:hypothetical protein
MSLQTRLQKVDRALDPTQLVVRWLAEVQTWGSLDAWMAGHEAAADREPVSRLATETAHAVRASMKGRPSQVVEEAIAAAVEAVLLRVFMVLVLHDHLATEQRVDALELELLTATLGCLAHGGTPELDAAAWGERGRRLLHETLTWQAAIALLATRYFADHAPVFPDQMAELDATVQACLALLERASCTDLASGAGMDVPAVDLAAVRQRAETDAELTATSIADRAVEDANVFTGTQAGVFRLRGLGGRPWAG